MRLLVWIGVIVMGSLTAQAKPLSVVASFSILGDVIQNVGGKHVAVTSIVGRNADTHMYNPTPQDSMLILKADLVVINGLGFETWFSRLVKASGYRGPILEASQAIQPLTLVAAHSTQVQVPDPHVWNDVRNMVIWVDAIEKALSDLDPAHRQDYQANAKKYTDQLRELDQWIRDQFKGIPPEFCKVITAHDAFRYFEKAYGLVFKAPQGISTVDEPSAMDMVALIQLIKKEKITTLFVENITNQRLIQQLASEAGAKIGGTLYSDALSLESQPASTYLKLMRHNVTQLVSSLPCFVSKKS